MTSTTLARDGSGRAANSYVGATELSWMAGLLAIDLILLSVGGEAQYRAVSLVSPFGLVLILGVGAWKELQSRREAIWTPLFWFRVSTSFYFGIGSLAPQFVNEATRQYMSALYRASIFEQARVNFIFALCIFLVLTGAALTEVVYRPSRLSGKGSSFAFSESMLPAGLAFWGVGSAYKYLVGLPKAMGWFAVTIPGAISNLGVFSDVGIFLLTAYVVNLRPRYWPMIVILVVTEILAGLLTFSKLEVILPGLMFGLGLLTAGITLWRVTALVSSFFLSLTLLQPMIAHARIQQVLHQGSLIAATSPQTRAGYLISYFGLEGSARDRSGVATTWARISYLNAGAFVVAQRDAGSPGDSLRYAFVSLVPRFVWPDKPITTNVGVELATLATGRRGLNSIAPGWFAEAYWNLGWGGLPAVCLPIGVLFTFLSRVARRVLEKGDWVSLPVLFIGVRIASRVDGQIVTDVIGPTAILLGYAAALVPVRAFLTTERTKRGPGSIRAPRRARR